MSPVHAQATTRIATLKHGSLNTSGPNSGTRSVAGRWDRPTTYPRNFAKRLPGEIELKARRVGAQPGTRRRVRSSAAAPGLSRLCRTRCREQIGPGEPILAKGRFGTSGQRDGWHGGIPSVRPHIRERHRRRSGHERASGQRQPVRQSGRWPGSGGCARPPDTLYSVRLKLRSHSSVRET